MARTKSTARQATGGAVHGFKIGGITYSRGPEKPTIIMETEKSPVKKPAPKKEKKPAKISTKRAPVAKISAEERKIASRYALLIYKALAEHDHILVREDPAAFGDDFSYEEQFHRRLESIIEDYNLLSEEEKRVSSIRGNKKESWFQHAMKILYGDEDSYFELNQEPWLQLLVDRFIEECEKVSVPKENVKSSKKTKAKTPAKKAKTSLDSKNIRKALAKFAKSVNLSLQKTDDLDEINYAVFAPAGVQTRKNVYSEMNKDDLKDGFRDAVKDFDIRTAILFDSHFIYVAFAESLEKLDKCTDVLRVLSDTGSIPESSPKTKAVAKKHVASPKENTVIEDELVDELMKEIRVIPERFKGLAQKEKNSLAEKIFSSFDQFIFSLNN